jgi:hypothetical protein
MTARSRETFLLFPAAIAAFLAATAAPAFAQTPSSDDEVDLVDGSTLHGVVTEQAPGSYVIIRTTDGRVQSVPWSQVKRVSTATSPILPPPVAPALARDPSPAPVPPSTIEAPAEADEGARKPLSVALEAGVRLGYSFSSGDYYQGTPIGSSSSAADLPGLGGAIPFAIDAGMRIGPYVFAGAAFQYALLNSSCFSSPGLSLSCSGHDIRGGLEVIGHFAPRGKIDPWIGVGMGHEWLELDISASEQGASAQLTDTFDGWNFADLMIGADFHVGAHGGIGPYFELTSGSFTNVSQSGSSSSGQTTSGSGDITSQSSHQWFTLGVRGTYEVR